MATINGTSARNVLRGTSFGDTINGRAGNDDLYGLGGIDRLYGGTGNDRLYGGLGNDFLYGGAGNDILSGEAGTDRLNGGLGNDTYVLGADNDVVIDSGGIDTITSTKTRSLAGYAGIENLLLLGSLAINGTGNALNNIITGNAGVNVLDGGNGRDRLVGGGRSDTYVVNSLTDTIVELAGAAAGTADRVRWTGSANQTFVLAANLEILDLLGGAATNGTGNSLDNTIIGNAAVNILDGGAGHDTLDGGAGNDTYVLGADADIIIDSAGIDTIVSTISRTLASSIERLTLQGSAAVNGTGNASANLLIGNGAANTLSGLAENDTLRGMGGNDVLVGGAGADTLDGGDGIDWADYSASGSAVFLTLYGASAGGTQGDALGDVFINVENARGTNGFDIIIGDDPNNPAMEHNNVLEGLGGNDLLSGGGLHDTLIGGSGDDTLRGGAGNDLLMGGGRQGGFFDSGDIYHGDDGIDTVSYADALAGVGVDLVTGAALGAAAGDTYSGIENIIGSPFDDNGEVGLILRPKDGGFAFGGAGDDWVQAGGGTLGSTLRGDAGWDTLIGGSGSGVDKFWLQLNQAFAVDVLSNFQRGIDKLVVSAAEFGISTIVFNTTVTGSMAQFIWGGGSANYLLFDSDGTGPGIAVAIAKFKDQEAPISLSADDFAFI